MPTNPEPTVWTYVLIGAAAFLLGGCATVLVHLLKKKKNGEGDRP